jgi:hypothetical protein
VEKNLAEADPYNTEALATLGDLYAEQKAGGREDLATAGPFWRRIPGVHPGSPDGYLEAATIFWDYFEFDDALTEVTRREPSSANGRSTDTRPERSRKASAIQQERWRSMRLQLWVVRERIARTQRDSGC